MPVVIAADNPQRDDVQAILHAHLAFARNVTPPEHVHAMGLEGLLHPTVTLFSARQGSTIPGSTPQGGTAPGSTAPGSTAPGHHGAILAVGALRHLDDTHAELKSMHTLEAARGQGVGRAMVGHLLSVAAVRGYGRVSLETGTQPAFAPARRLYQTAGFTPCEPFADYAANPWSTCMTITL